MTTAGTPTGKLDAIAKWSLIVGPLLVIIFNFLMPTNGIEPINPEDSDSYIKALGDDAGIVQVYTVIILLGIILYTRAIIGLWRIAPEGQSRYRMTIGVLGGVSALSLWAIVLALTLAETSIAEKLATATAGAQAGVAGAAEQAGAATIIAKSIHAALFGVYQTATYVAYISLIPLGGGLAISGIIRKEWGWAIALIGAATVILTSIFPVKTEEGVMLFGIMALIWGIVLTVMGIMIAKADMD
ncbi:hypothetical protein [Candidatus Lucifugimonas marina]|uniref:DUF4386 family protein n=1 Tax=Candidatus Lucifugimonas marina TaxID=3038979 RepID=A0AAJ6CSC3_9CHLR|nr:hypothetical protein [SAR202 cluster bacterium JH702]MDG0868539.1 hypothetical protein [SAR202 cluster bacterium JH639]WFG35178.1 hypothetical protein GKN94_05540 [SAR202 cluster bacterium JH545]WFG39128.1 hypothetical protein GKO48_05670 [SAR202 cluster bacterium JH1073]